MWLLTLAGAFLNVQRTNLQTRSRSENSRQATELSDWNRPGAAKAHNPAFNPPAHLRDDPKFNSTLAGDMQELTFGTHGKMILVKLILEKQGKTSEMRLEVHPQNEEP